MAKSTKTDRSAVVKKMKAQQRSAERRGSFMIVGVCIAVAVVIIAAAAWRPVSDWWNLRQFNDIDLASIGEAASVCEPETVSVATGEQVHIDEGDLDYEGSPPAFGEHRSYWDPMDRKFYSWDDRPELETLVHNLEHGYTFLWYDETAAEDDQMMEDIRGIASKLRGTDNFRLKFKAVPWKGAEDRGDPFPDGQHIALTRWTTSVDPAVGDAIDDVPEAGEDATGWGITEYCAAPSGEAVERFMLRWPYTNSVEPQGG